MTRPAGPRSIVEALECDAPMLGGAGDRFSGYGIIGLPFQSGHILALRRFPASSIGPGYTCVWHRDPAGKWTFYSTVPPDVSCARYFGGQVDHNIVTPIDITWEDSMRFRVAAGTAIGWHVTLGTSPTTRLLNTIAGVVPERAWEMPTVLRLTGVAARATLGTGRLNLMGRTPNGHWFIGRPRRLWLIESSHAVVEGASIGAVGPLTDPVACGDLLLPRRGLFVVARARFERSANRAGVRGSRAGACAFDGSIQPPDASRDLSTDAM